MNKPVNLDEINRANEAKENRLYREYIKRITDKFNMCGLHLDLDEGTEPQVEQSIQEVKTEQTKLNKGDIKFCTAKVLYKGKPTEIKYSLTKK